MSGVGQCTDRLRCGLSLLEVIIATAILAASGVMLMSMFSTGDRHTRRADERTIAQMLCQSKLDELLSAPSELVPIEADVDPQYPGWVFGIMVEPTQLEGFVKLSVKVTRIPGMDTGADLELATKATDEIDPLGALSSTSIPDKPTYELVRWLPFQGDLSEFDDYDSGGFGSSTVAGSAIEGY